MPKNEWHIGDLHIKKLKKQGLYSVRVRLHDADGKRLYSPARKVEARDKDSAVEQAIAYRNELLNRTPATLHATVNAYHNKRLDTEEVDNLTIKREESEMKTLFKYFDDMPLSDITTRLIDDTMVQMAKDGISQHKRSKQFSLLNRTLKYARKRDDLISNPCDLCEGYSYKGPDEERKAKKRITTDQLVCFLADLEAEERTGKVVALYTGIYTGFRRGEILGLEWQDVDFAHCRIHVRRQYGQQHKTKKTKTKQSMRTVKVDTALMEYLEEWKNELEKRHGFIDSEFPVCPNELGGHIDPGNFSRWRTRYFVRHGLGRWTTEEEWTDSRGIKRVKKSNYEGADMQAIRRAQATMLVGAGVDPKTVQHRLGHSQLATTMQYYAEMESGNDEAAANAVGAILHGGAA